MYWTFVLAVVITVLVAVGLIYLWDHFITENMKKSTIAILSAITIVVLGGLIYLCVLSFKVHDIKEIGNIFSFDKENIDVQNDSIAVQGVDSIIVEKADSI